MRAQALVQHICQVLCASLNRQCIKGVFAFGPKSSTRRWEKNAECAIEDDDDDVVEQDQGPQGQGREGGQQGDSDTSSFPDWAKLNAKDRKLSMQFLCGTPLAFLVIIRLTMEPLRTYMEDLLTMAGDKWHQRQQASVASDINNGRAPSRKFRLSELAAGSLDNAFFQQVATAL